MARNIISAVLTICFIVIVAFNNLPSTTAQSDTGYRLPTFQEFLIFAPKVVRPDMVYEVHVTLNRKYYSDIVVTALLSSDNNEYANGRVGFSDVGTKIIQMKVPVTVRNGTHKLVVEGLVQNKASAAVSTNASDVTDFTSYLPIYHNESYVIFSQKYVSIFVVLDRPCYVVPATILYRVVAVYKDLKPASGSMTIYVRDAKGNFVRRWIQRQMNFGMFSGGFDLEYPVNVGDWAIVIDAFGYRYEQPFEVRFWWQRSFEMNITVPQFMYDTEWGVMALLYGEHVSGEPGYGNGSIVMKLMDQDGTVYPGELYRDLGYMYSTKSFCFSMDEIKSTWPNIELAGKDLYFLGSLTDYYYLETLTGTGVTHIIKDGIKLKVLGRTTRTFKPDVPFHIQVALMRNDGTMYEGFYDRQLVVTVASEPGSPSSTVPEDKRVIPDDNILDYEVMPGMSDRIIRVTVTHPASGNTVEILCYRYYSAKNRYLALTSSTDDPRTEAYMTFTVRANFYVNEVNYLITAGGDILLGSKLVMNAKQKTFAVALSREMAPSAHIVAYCIVEGEVVTDALSFYVRDTRLKQPTFYINYGKDFRQDWIELVAKGPPGGYVFTTAVDYEMMLRGGLPFITEQKVIHELMTYDQYAQSPYQHTWWVNDLTGQWEKTVFFPTATTGMDTNTTIDAAGLIILSDANITIRQDYSPCNRSLGLGICPLSYQCYELKRACNGIPDCTDGYDEIACPLPEDQKYKMRPNELYTLFWNSRYQDNWNMFWNDHYIKQVGQAEIRILQDELMDPLVFGAFFMHPDQGLSICNEWVQHDTTRKFFVTIEAPDSIRRGEQVGLRLDVYNYWDQDMEVIIMLHGDESYKFIHVEDFGYVVSYAPRTSFGDFMTMLSIKGGLTCTYFMMPIVSTLTDGEFTVKISAYSSQREDYEEVPISITYDGVIGRYRHTPYLVDLVNTGSLIIPDLKINISQRFVDPGARDLLYIPYSGKATLYVYGDLVSPGMFEDHLTAQNTAWAFHDSAEGYIYEFGVNLQTLNYLQTINLLDVGKLNITLEYLQTVLMRQYAYMQEDGSYKMFRRAAKPCVRLTATVLRILHQAIVSQWTETLYIPIDILNNMTLWLADQQDASGAFIESSEYYYDRSFWPNTTDPSGVVHTWHIPITAHVVIALAQATRLTGAAKQAADAARVRAADYLGTKILSITDPFQMAITSYALQAAFHKDKDTAYNRLRPMGVHNTTKYLYWAAQDIPDNPSERINNVEFQYERQFHPNVGNAVMATSYALLCYLAHNDLKSAVPIMKFIVSQHNHLMGWSSTQDSLLALEALTAFSYSQTNRAFYNLELSFVCSSNNTWSESVQLNKSNFADLYTFPITPAFGQIKTRATGTGYAVVALDHWVHYEKPYQVRSVGPPYRSFDLDIAAQRFYGRNFSHMEMEICFKWTRLDLAPVSGMANVIVEIPTGFIISRDIIEWMYVQNFTALRRVAFYMQKLILFFEYVGPNTTCFSFVADRWWPVANTSIDHLIMIQEYSETGLQNLSAYNAITLFQLHICQVCGSFQCPYCEYYNAAPPIHVSSTFVLFLMFCSLITSYMIQFASGGARHSWHSGMPGRHNHRQ